MRERDAATSRTGASLSTRALTGLGAVALWLGACASPGYQGHDAGPQPVLDLGPYRVRSERIPYPTYCGDESPCPVGSVCRTDGFCSDTTHERCSFDSAGQPSQVTSNGDPCAISSVSVDGAAAGVGMSAEFCAALSDDASHEAMVYGDVFADGCRWTDGSALVTPSEDECYGFPAVLADNYWMVWWSFCGGPCGNVPCGDYTLETNTGLELLLGDDPVCAGRNDRRAFGVCTATATRCSADRLYDVRGCDHWLSGALRGEQVCACMFTDLDGSEPGAEGWVVPHSVCARYRELYPDSVNCRDEDFGLMP
jgi:hypothetical protein